jgi:hypothetical protein
MNRPDFLIGAALGLIVVCCSARAAPDDQDLHRMAGGIIAAGVSGWTGSAWQGAAAGCAANVAKEALDAAGMGVADRRDIVSGCAGAAVGALVGVGAHRLFVRQSRDAVTVGVRFSF